MTRKFIAIFVLGIAVFSMGISMPSCPGDQATHQRIDALQAKQAELTKTIQQMDSQIKAMNLEINQAKGIVAQLVNSAEDSKKSQEQIQLELQAAVTRLTEAEKKFAKVPVGSKRPVKSVPRNR